MKKICKVILMVIFLGSVGIGLFLVFNNNGFKPKQEVMINKPKLVPTMTDNTQNAIVTSSPEIVFEPVVLKLHDDIISKPIVDKKITVGPLVEDDYHFKGISINYRFLKTSDAIRKIIGNPNRIEEKDWKDPGIREKTYYYSNFRIVTLLIEEREDISEIVITGKGPKTARGLTVGDAENKIIEKYGPEEKLDNSCYCYQYENKDEVDSVFNAIQFDLENGLIKKIWIYFAPD